MRIRQVVGMRDITGGALLVKKAFDKMRKTANQKGAPVFASINGVGVAVNPGDYVEDFMRHYHRVKARNES